MDDLNFKTIVKKAFDLLWANAQSITLSRDDKDHARGFGANLRALDALITAFQVVAKEKSVELRVQWNTSLPISKLPLEILVSVFELDLEQIWDDTDGAQLPSRIGTLSSVSKSWSNIIQSTSSLWSRIHTTYPINFVRAAIERSGEHGITVGGVLSHNNSSRRGATLSICNQIPRWLSAKLTADADTELGLLTGSAAPVLQSLDVVYLQTDDSARVPINFFGGQAPALKHIVLDGLHAVWTSPIFTNLHTLAFYDVLGLTVNHILTILQYCPHLQHATLCQVRLSAQSDTTPQGRPVLTLLNLKELHIQECADELLHGVLTNIACPNASRIVLTLPTPTLLISLDQQLLALEPVIAFTIAFIKRGIAAGESINFDWKPAAYVFTFGDLETEGSILCIQNLSDFPIHDGFVNALNKKTVLPDLSLTISGQARGRWRNLGNLNCVTKLVVLGESGLVTYLGTPVEEGDALRWPFPNLKTLYLKGAVCEEPEEIVQMVRGRQGCLGGDSTKTKYLPKPFESLAVLGDCPMDEATLSKLIGILPETAVEWEPSEESEDEEEAASVGGD